MSTESSPSSEEGIPPTKIYNPLSFPVLALLIPASVLGVLARLGLVVLMSYDGHAVFPLAYPQAVGCLVMGFALGLKEPIGQMYVLALSFLRRSHSYFYSGMVPFIQLLLQVRSMDSSSFLLTAMQDSVGL